MLVQLDISALLSLWYISRNFCHYGRRKINVSTRFDGRNVSTRFDRRVLVEGKKNPVFKKLRRISQHFFKCW